MTCVSILTCLESVVSLLATLTHIATTEWLRGGIPLLKEPRLIEGSALILLQPIISLKSTFYFVSRALPPFYPFSRRHGFFGIMRPTLPARYTTRRLIFSGRHDAMDSRMLRS